ncbi:MAG: TlpA family protein disulfide reductase [Spirochaetales bacterium]|nr:TlpA family protein disulfide reductase [Spirochaetales bacterium]
MRKKFLGMVLVVLIAAGCGPSGNKNSQGGQQSSKFPEDLKDMMAGQGLVLLDGGDKKYVDFEAENLAGETVKLSSYAGKVIFLNFWATWCGPCRSEMKSMEQLYRLLKDEGMVIVAVNIQENRDTVAKFTKDRELTFPVLRDWDGSIAGTYGVGNLPTTYVFDRNGMLVTAAIGAREWYSEKMVEIFRQFTKGGN